MVQLSKILVDFNYIDIVVTEINMRTARPPQSSNQAYFALFLSAGSAQPSRSVLRRVAALGSVAGEGGEVIVFLSLLFLMQLLSRMPLLLLLNHLAPVDRVQILHGVWPDGCGQPDVVVVAAAVVAAEEIDDLGTGVVLVLHVVRGGDGGGGRGRIVLTVSQLLCCPG